LPSLHSLPVVFLPLYSRPFFSLFYRLLFLLLFPLRIFPHFHSLCVLYFHHRPLLLPLFNRIFPPLSFPFLSFPPSPLPHLLLTSTHASSTFPCHYSPPLQRHPFPFSPTLPCTLPATCSH
jgi:hypothetical protein